MIDVANYQSEGTVEERGSYRGAGEGVVVCRDWHLDFTL